MKSSISLREVKRERETRENSELKREDVSGTEKRAHNRIGNGWNSAFN